VTLTSSSAGLKKSPTRPSLKLWAPSTTLRRKLKEKKLELVSIVLDTLIPVGRFRMGSVEIDLVYCPCGASNWENVSEKDLRGQSETYVRSLDGIMEADAIFGLIPKIWWPTYATSVRALKFWAKTRRIYSSVMGYLSSNTISLLLAKVILETGIPSKPSTAEELVAEFFDFYSSWKWPTPVTFHGSSALPSLFPTKTPQRMPICSPSFPYLNRTRNMTKSTRTLIQREIIRGNEIFSSIPVTFDEKWRSLCTAENFFRKYPHYVKIDIMCNNEKDLRSCDGILRSKLVNLVIDLEKPLHILCQPYTEIHFPGSNALEAFIGCEDLPSAEAIRLFKGKLEKWTSGFVSDDIKIEVGSVSRENPSSDLDAFRKWETVPIHVDDAAVFPENWAAIPQSNDQRECESGNLAYSLKFVGIVCLVLGTIVGIRRYWK